MQLKSVLTENQRLTLWKFVRGDLSANDFEIWLYDETALEMTFEHEAYLALIGCNFHSKDDTFKIKASIREILEVGESCRCSAVRNLDNIEMGGDWFFEKFFATLTKLPFRKPNSGGYISHVATFAPPTGSSRKKNEYTISFT